MVKKVVPIVLAALKAGIVESSPAGFKSDGRFFYAQVNYKLRDTVHFSTNVGLGCDAF